jgi:hypothetical protein
MALERLSACDDVNEQKFAGLLLAIPRRMLDECSGGRSGAYAVHPVARRLQSVIRGDSV